MCTGMVEKVSLRSTLTIHAFVFMILKASSRDSMLKCLYSTNLFKYFKFKKCAILLLPCENSRNKVILFLLTFGNDSLLKKLINFQIYNAFVLCIMRNFRDINKLRFILKSVLRPCFTISRINPSFVMFFQSLK